MRKYRIKQKGNKYYPQYKDGIKTVWMWEYFVVSWNEVYPNKKYQDHNIMMFYSENDIDPIKKCEDFIKKDEEKRLVKIIPVKSLKDTRLEKLKILKK